VVAGADAHISGHTVEGAVLRTGGVRLGSRVTIGIGAIVDISVTVPSGCQIGALSFVPKHAALEAGGVYAGVTVHVPSEERFQSGNC
jgi:carbonic anhydrase/acetyltransferase-like protein (isoleucine patch superfamily)